MFFNILFYIFFMIILGIDPGVATTGYAIIECENNNIVVIDYGCILTPAEMDFPQRLVNIYQ